MGHQRHVHGADPEGPATAFVLANRAALRLQRGRGAEALEDLDRAVALAPDHPGLQRNRQLVVQALERAAPVRVPAAA